MARPVYPDVGNIPDRPTQQSVKGLWDRIFSHAQEIAAMQAQIDALQSTVTSLTSRLDAAERKISIISSPASA